MESSPVKNKKEEPKVPAGSPRPPVVTILGHIDHGKSTLLDYIRRTNTTAKEAGGITQHASAYEINYESKDGKTRQITFLDTPGHEAFSSIRTRCANVADIAVLIISAEDGVKPQTLEVIKYIKGCSIPFLVAITKVDKPTADINKTKQSLAENGVYVEGYGGNTPVVELSAVSGKGVEEFLDMIGLLAELEGKTGVRGECGSGTIIESRRDPKRGIIAVGIIKNGIVRKGLFAASSGAMTPLRFILDANGQQVEELSFSSPVQIVGWDKMPRVGQEFMTFKTKDEALLYAKKTEVAIEHSIPSKLAGDVVSLPIIIKADTAGSLEAIVNEVGRLSRERIVPKIILSGIGNINENDIKVAQTATGVIIVGFNVKTDPQVTHYADRLNIPITTFNIIYELTDMIDKKLTEKEPRIEVEEVEGIAKILKIFSTTKGKQVVGGRVLTGTIRRGGMFKIMRREAEIGRGRIKELQQFKTAADSVVEGTEFGALIESKMETAPGDVLETFTVATK